MRQCRGILLGAKNKIIALSPHAYLFGALTRKQCLRVELYNRPALILMFSGRALWPLEIEACAGLFFALASRTPRGICYGRCNDTLVMILMLRNLLYNC